MTLINTIVSVDDLRQNLAQILGRVMYADDRVLIKKYNRDAAVIISAEEYEKLLDPTKRLSKKQWNDTFKEIDKIVSKIPKKNLAALEKAIPRAIEEVRAEKRPK